VEAVVAQKWFPQIRTNDTRYKKDYIQLYIDHVIKFALQEDTTRPIVSSSPSNGLEEEKENWIAKDPQDPRYGDVHYYNYQDPLWNWKLFPSAKFASEYGFQSYPSLETLSQVIKESDLSYPITPIIQHRQHHPDGTNQIENQICKSKIFNKSHPF